MVIADTERIDSIGANRINIEKYTSMEKYTLCQLLFIP